MVTAFLVKAATKRTVLHDGLCQNRAAIEAEIQTSKQASKNNCVHIHEKANKSILDLDLVGR